MKDNSLLCQVLLVCLVSVLAIGVLQVEVSGGGIRVQPLRLTTDLEVNQSITKIITVVNNSNDPVTVELSRVDFDLSELGSLQFASPGSTTHSMGDWFTIPAEIQLDPGEERDISIVITRQSEASLTSYWAAIVINAGNTQITEAMELNLTYVIGIVQQDPSYSGGKGRIVDMEVAKAAQMPNVMDEEANSDTEQNDNCLLAVSVVFRNESETVLNTNTQITILDQMGNTVTTNMLVDSLILPEHERVLSANFYTCDWEPGSYLALAVVDYGGDNPVGGQWTFEIPEEE